MARHGKLSRDQKRKKKLAERARSAPQEIEPYEGNKYRSEQFLPCLFEAEKGIREADAITDHQLTDHQVVDALTRLIRELRGEHPPAPEHRADEDAEAGPEEWIIGRIEQRWEALFASRPRHSPTDLTGVLRTILSSVRVRARPIPQSRSYLDYLEQFLSELGFSVQMVSANEIDEIGSGADPAQGPPDADERIQAAKRRSWVRDLMRTWRAR